MDGRDSRYCAMADGRLHAHWPAAAAPTPCPGTIPGELEAGPHACAFYAHRCPPIPTLDAGVPTDYRSWISSLMPRRPIFFHACSRRPVRAKPKSSRQTSSGEADDGARRIARCPFAHFHVGRCCSRRPDWQEAVEQAVQVTRGLDPGGCCESSDGNLEVCNATQRRGSWTC